MGKLRESRVAVVGAGAVGCYFGGMLARAGASVTLLRRPKSASAGETAVVNAPLHMDSIHFQESINVAWASDPAAARDADVVLFCVKAQDNESAAQLLAPHVKTGAIVVSLQNGVDNVQRIHAASGIDALPTVVYVAASMLAPDRVKHIGRGDLIIGELPAARRLSGAPLFPTPSVGKGGPADLPRAERIAAMFEAAGVKCVVSPNVEADLWQKLMMNAAGNAITAIAQVSYGRVAAHEPSHQVVAGVINECVAVARAAGVKLPDTDYVAGAIKLSSNLGNATSSTAQDLAKGKRTEIDALNGYVARLGATLGVPTPVNSTLLALVKLLEETVVGQFELVKQR